MISKGRTKIICSKYGINIFWDEVAITKGVGLNVGINTLGLWTDSAKADWQILEKGNNHLKLKVVFKDLSLSQTWDVEIKDEHEIYWQIDMDVEEWLHTDEFRIVCLVNPCFKSWINNYQQGDFPRRDNHWQSLCTSDIPTSLVGVRFPLKDEPLPSFILEPKQTNMFCLVQNPPLNTNAHIIGLRHIVPEERKDYSPGSYHLFSGKINLFEDEYLLDVKIESLRRDSLEKAIGDKIKYRKSKRKLKVLLTNLPWQRQGKWGVRAGSRWPHIKDESEGNYLPFPFFLAYATSLLQKHGIDATLIDAIAERIPEDRFLEKIFGMEFDYLVAETSIPSFYYDLYILKKISQAGIPIILCGPNAEIYKPQFLKEYPFISFVLYGEYEFTLLELIKCLKEDRGLARVKGLIYNDNGTIKEDPLREPFDINLLPWPYREGLPMDKYLDTPGDMLIPSVQMMASRGCPFKCQFCLWPQVIYRGNHYRARNVKDVVDEMEYLVKGKGFKSVYFDDDSLPPNEEILIRQRDRVKRVKIGKLVNSILKRSHFVERINGREVACDNPQCIECFAFNPITLKSERTLIKRFIRHRTNKSIYEISLTSGKKIKVTEDHSVFSIDSKGKLFASRVSLLKKGDFLATPKRIDIPSESKNKINLVKKLLENLPRHLLKEIYVKSYTYIQFLNNIREKKKKIYKDTISLHNLKGYPPFVINNEILEEHKVYIGIKGQPKVCNSIIENSEELYWFLGLFTGDGSANDNFYIINFFPGKECLMLKVQKVLKDLFNLEAIRCEKMCVGLDSKIFYLILKYIFRATNESEKRGSKRIPDLVFNSSLQLRKAYIKGFCDAEGHYNKKRIEFNIVTAYKPLANDLLYLFLSLGERVKCYERINKKRYKDYILVLSIPDLELLGRGLTHLNRRSIPYVNMDEEVIASMTSIEKYNYQTLGFYPSPKTLKGILERTEIESLLFESDITFEKIVSIKKIKSSKYVYDLEVYHKNEIDNFIGGFGGVCLHNTFNIGKERMLKFCKLIKERKLQNIPWAIMARPDLMDEEILTEMKSAGLWAVKYGVESCIQSFVENCHKNLDLKRTTEIIKLTKELGIKFHLTFTFGFSGETKETIQRTIDYGLSLDPESVQFSILTPFPGTRLFEDLDRQGRILTRDWSKYDGHYHCVFKPDNLKPEDLVEAKKRAYRIWGEYVRKRRGFRGDIKRFEDYMHRYGLKYTLRKTLNYLTFIWIKRQRYLDGTY